MQYHHKSLPLWKLEDLGRHFIFGRRIEMAHTRNSQQSLGLSGVIFVIAVSLVVCSVREGLACPQYCLDVAYTTCTSTGDQHLRSYCNCCLVPNAHDCTLHLTDGSQISC